MLNSKVLTDDIFRREIKSLDRYEIALALAGLDRLYPQPNETSALQQLQIQLANPMPYDLGGVDLSEYRDLDPKWQDWEAVKKTCASFAIELLHQAA